LKLADAKVVVCFLAPILKGEKAIVLDPNAIFSELAGCSDDESGINLKH